MRLIKAYINGFRRFEKAAIDLDGNLLAVVGPNEAGKSSLLAALLSTEDSTSFKKTDIARSSSHSEVETSIELLFSLDQDESELAKNLGGIGEPRWYHVRKNKDGQLNHWVEPKIERDLTLREKTRDRIEKILRNPKLEKLLSKEYTLPKSDEKEQSQDLTLREILTAVSDRINIDTKSLPQRVFNDLNEALLLLAECRAEAPHSSQRTLEITEEILKKLIEVESRTHPQSQLLDELNRRQPQFLMFDDEARSLLGEYTIPELDNPPSALQNLLDLADLDPSLLKEAIDSNDHGKREKLIEKANQQLRKKLEKAWNQSPVYTRLQVDQEVIRILMNKPGTYSGFEERSDGVKAFVALYSYTCLNTEGPPPILLIDEAEAHLHYDAQADLVRVFETQEIASKIIYTTHSAGCLLNDLGTGIRVIKPVYNENGQDTGKSIISNSFWTEGAGFSPLMLAMGASIMALVPARRAVIAEGPSDLILLPTLLREATGLEKLDFQVAPGLANVSADQAIKLSLEAPIVAYLIDGDEGGRKNRRKLKAAGVSDRLILDYDANRVIEDFLNIEIYLAAINLELRRSHGSECQITKNDLNDTLRPCSLKEWCKSQGIKTPHTVKVALHVLSLRNEHSLLDSRYSKLLENLHERILTALQPDSKFDQ